MSKRVIGIPLKVLSTRAHGSAYVDIVRNGQTILTAISTCRMGQADLTLTATPDMAGTLDINAYLFGRDASPSRSSSDLRTTCRRTKDRNNYRCCRLQTWR